jgi:hypothetical protein
VVDPHSSPRLDLVREADRTEITERRKRKERKEGGEEEV